MYLNTHTYYSLRYGVFDAHTLVELAQENGISSLALTDINTTSACMNFIREARKCGIKPVVGVDIRNGVQQRFILIAKNNDGFQRINHYLTTILLKEETELYTAPELKNVWTIYPYVKGEKRTLREYEFIGVRPENIPSIRLQKCATDKMVILQPATFRTKKDFNAHRLLRAIDLNTLLSKLPSTEQAFPSDQMLPLGRLIQLFEGYPEIIRNTRRILEESTIDFDLSDDKEPQNQKTYTGSVEEDMDLLLKLCKKGLKYRYPVPTEEIFNRISKELDTIKKMGFVSYFLMNWDIVKYARSKGYFYVGRGSGANSVVAYLLRITDVDPIELDLYFERFINLYRTNPPDFDIDFSWKDRDDVTRYIFERFDHVALVATYNTFQRKAVLRELGKVFGLPKEEIDLLTKDRLHPSQRTHLTDLVVKYAHYIHGFPSHLSVHASGIVIAEKPIHYFTATFLPPKGYPTVQFDMHVAEDVGLYKFDILSQRGLGKIKDTLEIIGYNRPDQGEIDIHNMRQFKSDERIKTMLREANAIGCFYVESPAMRMLLRKLQVDDYLGLVAASSVIRPGVAKSGMMSEYIKRFRHPERRNDANPVLLKLMPETFGVMVYQEDVIKVAYHFAGLTLGEADKMRRGMSGKFRSREEFQAVKNKFFKNCTEEKGHSPELTAEVWRQTESFAGYAFAKGHSASYAVESYQCLFLKAYFPLEFMVATINNYGGFYSTELYIQEARKFGGIIFAPCVNNSQLMTVIEGNKIYLGFHLIKSFDSQMGKKITVERIQNGPFKDLNDFLERIPVGIEQLILLMRMDAFRFTGKDKRTLLWEAHLKVSKSVNPISPRDLFRFAPKEYQIPALSHTQEEAIFDQMELLNFPLFSPFTIVRPDPTPFILAKDLHRYENQNVWIKGYLIHAKKTTTSKGERMFFGTLLDEEGEWLDTVHFPQIAAQFPFRGKGVYKVYGTVLMEYDCTNIQAISMEKMSIIEDPRYSEAMEEKAGGVVTTNRRTHQWSRSNIAQAEVKASKEAQNLAS
ncbi:MAG: DNA polymerase III subunit alpha [Crocinitomicaceae bacterium]|nr:DNA polymerase III subunit alpha [Crocinitomicaceae bacterium]